MTFAEAFEEEITAITTFDGYAVEIGVFEENTRRKKTSVTNAELMYLHENGAPARNLPSRPVLKLSIKYLASTLWPDTRDYIISQIHDKGWKEPEIEKELMKMCIRLQSYARNKVIGGGKMLAPLKHPRRVPLKQRKGIPPNQRKEIPLKDTGQLQRSIRCVLLKNGTIIGP